ncbi:MAG: hypothetical protein ACTSU5_05660 [Promethearchaeota archaeon]
MAFLVPKIGYMTTFHPMEEGAGEATAEHFRGLELLKSLPRAEVFEAPSLVSDTSSARVAVDLFHGERVDVVVVRLATWSSDDPVWEVARNHDWPFVFWGLPGRSTGSLCGAQQFNAVFKELRRPCRFVYGDGAASLSKLGEYVLACSVVRGLRELRVLQIGNRTQGMAEVTCDEHSLREVLGCSVEAIGTEKFKEVRDGVDGTTAREKWEELAGKVARVSVSEAAGITSVKNWLALVKIIDDGSFGAFTPECYPDFMGEVCLGCSLLADVGVPGACEGDVNSAVAMWMGTQVARQPVHDIDLLEVDAAGNTILGSHCGNGSLQLSRSPDDIEFAPVRLAERGLCVLFPGKPGPVTLTNLIGRKSTYRMGVLEGEAVETAMVFPGNPVRVKIPVPARAFLDAVEENGLGHHWIVTYGHHAGVFREVCRLTGVRFVDIGAGSRYPASLQ